MSPVSDGEDLVSRARSIFARLREDQGEAAHEDSPTNGASPPEPEQPSEAQEDSPATPEGDEPPVTVASVEWSTDESPPAEAEVIELRPEEPATVPAAEPELPPRLVEVPEELAQSVTEAAQEAVVQ